ncbi:MAG TPA: hypothetical protein GYA03_05735 [Tissierellia bacterium]|nr:hypothetical protein [Tissierellia bacterium]
MIEYRYRLLRLFEAIGEINGRKRLQKMFFIIQSLGYDLDLDYTYHNYGPYSSQLQAEVDFQIQEKLINEEFISNTYVYKLQDEGKQLLQKLYDNGLTGFSPNVPENVIEKLRSQETKFLELVSTIIYLRDFGFEGESLKGKVDDLKPHLMEYYPDALEFIDDLRQ